MDPLWYPLLFLTTALFLLYKYFNRNLDYWQRRNVVFIKPLPIVGNLKDLLVQKYSISEMMQYFHDKGKGEPYVGLYMFGKPVLLLRSPKIIKDVLQKDFNSFDNRTATAPDHDKILKNMMLFAKNPNWKNVRQKVSPTYTSGKLKNMFPHILEIGDAMIKYLSKHVDEAVDAKELASKFTNDVVAKTAFAINAGCFESEECEFRTYSKKITEPRFLPQLLIFFSPTLVKFLNPDLFGAEVRTFFLDAFNKSLELREKSGSTGNDLVDILVDIKKKDINQFWDTEVLMAQALQFFIAGTETTAQTISFTLYEVALQPDIQNKLRNEINTMLEETNGKVEYERLLNLKYLDMCVKETIRKYPALPYLDRQCNKDYVIEETGLVIEKGTNVYMSTFGLGYDEEFFPNSQKYDPERFADMTKINQNGLYYLPFGEGPRICIGERFGLINVKIALAYILKYFEVLPTSETKVPLEFLKEQVLMVPIGGLPLEFKRLTNIV